MINAHFEGCCLTRRNRVPLMFPFNPVTMKFFQLSFYCSVFVRKFAVLENKYNPLTGKEVKKFNEVQHMSEYA